MRSVADLRFPRKSVSTLRSQCGAANARIVVADTFHAFPAGEQSHSVSGDSVAELLTGRSDCGAVVAESYRGNCVLHASFTLHFRQEVK